MISRMVKTLVLLAAAAEPVRGEYIDCSDCILGLYADPQLTQTQAEPNGSSIDLYLGIRYAADVSAELVATEFSIAGLDSFMVTFEPYDSPTVVLGRPAAPSGLDTLSAEGGMLIGWPTCLTGDRALMKLTLFPRGPWPTGAAFRVKHRYPPSNAEHPWPLVVQCDDPFFTQMRVGGGAFTLGPAGPPTCTVATTANDFGVVGEGEIGTLAVTVTNTGAGLLDGFVSTDRADFTFYETDHSFLLAHGQQKPFQLRFTPTQPGAQLCTVSFATECEPIQFVGRAPAVVPIAAIHANIDSFLGRKVAVEAQVFIPTNHHPWSLPGYPGSYGWIQDASGRGLQVVCYPVQYRGTLQDPANRVRVSGTVARDGTIVRLLPTTAATLLDGGNPLLQAPPLSAVQAADPAWEGTYLEVHGRILSRTSGDSEERYKIQDPTGEIDVLDAPYYPARIPLGHIITARGAGASDEEGFYVYVGRYADMQDLGPHALCPGRWIGAGMVPMPVGQPFVLPIRMFMNSSPVDSIGFNMSFDSRVLRFASGSPCNLTAGWTCDFQLVGSDTLVVTGTGPEPIPVNSAGTLVCVEFDVLACLPTTTLLQFDRLQGDLAGLETCEGRVYCGGCRSNGDVNGNGTLTPGDAECAFEIFLEGETLPTGCDVAGNCEIIAADFNCDLGITPGDALEIFTRWLNRQAMPVDCAAKPGAMAGRDAPAFGATTSPYRLDPLRAEILGNGLRGVPLDGMGVAAQAAFAGEIRFDSTRVRFVELVPRSAGAAWQGMGARLVGPGHLRIGGYHVRASSAPAPAARAGWVPLAQLVFATTTSEGPIFDDVTWLERIARDDGVAALPTRFFLGAPHPNPSTDWGIAVDLSIPTGRTLRVEARVLDVRGRLVRLLEQAELVPGNHVLKWDTKDGASCRVAAGIYVLEVRAGEHLEHRKVVVLE